MYREVPGRLTAEQVDRLVQLSARADLAPGPGGSRITPLGPLTDEAVAIIEPSRPVKLAQFVALHPSCQLVAHTDPPILAIRLHFPILTNSGCWVFYEGRWGQLEVGKAYAMDPTIEHGAVNWGSAVRIHLMLDLEV